MDRLQHMSRVFMGHACCDRVAIVRVLTGPCALIWREPAGGIARRGGAAEDQTVGDVAQFDQHERQARQGAEAAGGPAGGCGD
eukprot:929864-Pyramimonas_sp.AAC.1